MRSCPLISLKISSVAEDMPIYMVPFFMEECVATLNQVQVIGLNIQRPNLEVWPYLWCNYLGRQAYTCSTFNPFNMFEEMLITWKFVNTTTHNSQLIFLHYSLQHKHNRIPDSSNHLQSNLLGTHQIPWSSYRICN